MITVRSAVLVGIESRPVTITAEVSMSPGGLMITGLSAPAMREARVRVKSALAQCGIEAGNVDVTVTPEVAAYPGSLDLAIAIAIATLRGKCTTARRDVTVIGELALDGHVHQVRGVVAHARAAGTGHIIVPAGNATDAAVTKAQVLYCDTLEKAIAGEYSVMSIMPHRDLNRLESQRNDALDIADIPSPTVRRALEISAAGRHPLLLVGAPGSGKTMAARRLAGILPSLTADEALDVLTIHDAAGLRGGGWGQALKGAPVSRPFRAPHHTVSEIGLLGGGDAPRPGEVTLAHHGVLFLDEVHEFRKSALEALGRVLAEGKVTLRRTATMPASPLLVGATNPCGCGPSYVTGCKCTPERLKSYRDRAVAYESLFAMRVDPGNMAHIASGRIPVGTETSATVRARVEAARKILASTVPGISPEAQRLFDKTSTTALFVEYGRTVSRVARTIAALDGTDIITGPHMAEALSFQVRP
jgi:magnesium chelatase family protein